MMTQATQCKHCTVPINANGPIPLPPNVDDVCGFCATYVPPETPAQRLEVGVNRVDLLRADINAVLRELPPAAPLMAVVDIVTALGHLRQAAVLIDKATDTLEADATEALR